MEECMEISPLLIGSFCSLLTITSHHSRQTVKKWYSRPCGSSSESKGFVQCQAPCLQSSGHCLTSLGETCGKQDGRSQAAFIVDTLWRLLIDSLVA